MVKSVAQAKNYLDDYTWKIKSFHQDQKKKKEDLIQNLSKHGKQLSEKQMQRRDNEARTEILEYVKWLKSNKEYKQYKEIYHQHTQEIRKFIDTFYASDDIEVQFADVFKTLKETSIKNNIDSKLMKKNLVELLEHIKYIPKEDLLEEIWTFFSDKTTANKEYKDKLSLYRKEKIARILTDVWLPVFSGLVLLGGWKFITSDLFKEAWWLSWFIVYFLICLSISIIKVHWETIKERNTIIKPQR